MQFGVKLLASVAVIVICTQIGRKWPTLGGLIATMPLTSLIVLLWLYSDNPTDLKTLADYTKGVVWGIVPTALFFLAAFFCFSKKMSLWVVLSASFAVWLIAAAIHQLLLSKYHQ